MWQQFSIGLLVIVGMPVLSVGSLTVAIMPATEIPLPPTSLREALPSRDEVLAQAIPFDPDRWKRLLPDAALWPSELDHCVVNGRWPVVDRATVFRVAARDEDRLGAAQMFIAASVWGVGTSARMVSRRMRTLTEETTETIGAKIVRAITVGRAQGPSAAYAQLCRGGELHIHGIGPSFFTKLLYFASHHMSETHPAPLILDQYVVASLNALGVASWPPLEWSSDQYQRWLELAHGWAGQLGGTVTGDVIEYALFRDGKSR
jgi:hypothetical protein